MAEKYREQRMEEVTSERGGLAKFGAHCRKFWWLHLILFSVILITILLPFIYVAYPNSAQQDVNRSTLTVKSLAILDPAPDSFHIKLTQVIGSKSIFHPVLDGFNATVSMVGSSVPFAYLQTPQVKAKDGAEGQIDQRVVLPSVDAFTAFSTAVLLKDKVDMSVFGKTGLKLGGLQKINVTYNHTTTLTGLNSLKGFNLTSFRLILPPEDDGTNMRGNITIPNPSPLHLELGNVTLDLSVDGTPIGQSRIQDLVVKPGDNYAEMAATVNQTVVFGLVLTKYKNSIIPVDIVGNSSVYNGKELTYYSKALAANKLRIDMDLSKV